MFREEVFGPVLHVIRWKAGELDKVIDAVNSTGYGLTLGLQSRIDTVRELLTDIVRRGTLQAPQRAVDEQHRQPVHRRPRQELRSWTALARQDSRFDEPV